MILSRVAFAIVSVLAGVGLAAQPAGQDPTAQERPYTGGRSMRWTHAMQLLPAADLLLHYDSWSLVDPPPELAVLEARIATDLMMDAADILAAGTRAGLGKPSCAGTEKELRQLGEWTAKDVEDVGISWTGSPITRFSRGKYTLRLRCVTERENATTCTSALYDGTRLVLGYSVGTPHEDESFNGQVRLGCGGAVRLSMGGESPATLRWEPEAYPSEVPFEAIERPSEILASSQLQPKTKAYAPERLADGRFATAWCEGSDGTGIGEWIELRWKQPVEVRDLGIVSGYAKSRALFYENGAPKKLRVTADTGEVAEISGFDDRPSMQVHKLDALTKPVKSLRIEMVEVRPGSKYQDTCISELVVSGGYLQ